MKFKFDPKGLPGTLKDSSKQTDFKDRVEEIIKGGNGSGTVARGTPMFAAIVGMLVLDGYTDHSAAGFIDEVWRVYGEAHGTTEDSTGKDVPNAKVYKEVAKAIAARETPERTVYYQELAAVSRQLIENSSQVPYDDPTYFSQIFVYDDDYVSGETGGAGSLEIPDLSDSGSTAGPDDIRRANIEAVAVVAAAYNLEQARLFDVVDRIMETWWNGQLPVGFDRGSKALDDLFWASDDRLTPAARHMQYSRVLGVAGGEVSTEVQPNTQFDMLLQRFVASLAEYDRQQRIGDIVASQRRNALTLTAEQVRSAGRNLAANASLYGWGGTQFAARRIAGHIKKAFLILNSREIQAAYGVDGPWKVVERVAQELGAVPNLVKWQTQANATKTILDIVAKYSSIWSGSKKSLFTDPGAQKDNVADRIDDGFGSLTDELHNLVLIASGKRPTTTRSSRGGGLATVTRTGAATSTATKPTTTSLADIDDADRDMLMRQAGNYIAVNGIRDDAVEELSQPAEAQYAPSIPSLTSAISGSDGGGGIDQLRQMVAAGQVPSLDQLKSIVMPTA
jgi:hypothetical protein